MPAAKIGTFTGPATTLAHTLVSTTFTIGGVSLAPSTNYWLVLHGFSGWGWTADVTSSWATSPDSGMSWTTSTLNPPQFSVISGLAAIGDYNGDGTVDAADYTVWRDTLGSTTDLRANGNNSGASAGIIDQADYDYWERNFGRTIGSGASDIGGGAVPEPSTLSLIVVGCMVSLLARHRKFTC